MKNPLDVLFREVKREMHRSKLIQAPPAPKLRAPPQTLYSNPENWTLGRSIEVHHGDTNEVLGIFREYFHKRTSATRRLLPAPPGTLADGIEVVFGEWWLHPRFTGPLIPEDTEHEVRALKDRFQELLDECWEEVEDEYT